MAAREGSSLSGEPKVDPDRGQALVDLSFACRLRAITKQARQSQTAPSRQNPMLFGVLLQFCRGPGRPEPTIFPPRLWVGASPWGVPLRLQKAGVGPGLQEKGDARGDSR